MQDKPDKSSAQRNRNAARKNSNGTDLAKRGAIMRDADTLRRGCEFVVGYSGVPGKVTRIRCNQPAGYWNPARTHAYCARHHTQMSQGL